MSAILFLVFLPASSMFLVSGKRRQIWKLLGLILHAEFNRIFGTISRPGSTWFLVSLFIFVFINNAIGLFPYIFTARRHLSFALSLALPLWLGHIVFSYIKQTNFALAHLVPKGTPVALISFMVLIETISNIIRPLTLSVRIMANITAGHLLLCLLRSTITLTSIRFRRLSLIALIILVILEVAVSLIQAYVFTLLSSLYLEEVQTKSIIIWWVSIYSTLNCKFKSQTYFLIVKK